MNEPSQRVLRLIQELDLLSTEEWESVYEYMNENSEFKDLTRMEERCHSK